MDYIESIIAGAALLVSCVSVVFTALSVKHSRHHNRLSVRPIPRLIPRDFENLLEVVIENKGTGPLLVTDIRFYRPGEVDQEHLIDLLPPLRHGLIWNNFSKPKQLVLTPNERKVLIRFEGNPNDWRFVENRLMLRMALASITLEMAYTSIYGEAPPFHYSHDLDWFGRNV